MIPMGRLKYLTKDLSQCDVCHRSCVDWPGIEPGPLHWQAGD
jgi:hypothetical protein